MRPVPPFALALLLLGGPPRTASGAVVDEDLRARIDADAEAATAAIEAAARRADLEDAELQQHAVNVAALLAAEDGDVPPLPPDFLSAEAEVESYVAEVEDDEVEVDHRRLRELMADKMHHPLPCNAGVEKLEGSDCLPLSSLVASHDGSAPLTIPCGACAVCDVEDGSTLEVPSGVRVEGKLLFPASANATLLTTNVLVLGLLVMRPPGDGRKVTVRLHGEEDLYFHPHPDMPNQDACPEQGCKVGTKVIAVAGGRVDVRGGDYHGGCPSWEKIRDVGRMDTAWPSAAPSGSPTAPPTDAPSAFPSAAPTGFPSAAPTGHPVTPAPTPEILALCEAGAVLPGGSFSGEDVAAVAAANPFHGEPGGHTTLELVDCGDRFSTTSTTTAATTAATNSGPSVISARYEAEDQQMDPTSVPKTSNSGYIGGGYVDMGKEGSYVKFTNVDGGATGGTCTLSFRYANKGSDDRPLSVAINGDVAGTVAFPSTGSWTNWQTDTIVASCPAGNIELLLTATDENGPNLDGLDYDLVAAATTGATTSGPATVVAHYEAEVQQKDSTTYAKTSNSGYAGSGYMDMGGLGSYVKFTDVDGGAGGTCTLAFRYANGGDTDRPLSVAVNGVVVGTLAFPFTGWTTWGTETIEVACPAGSNEVLLTATSDNGPNLDSLDVTLVEDEGNDDDGTGLTADCALRVRRQYWSFAPSTDISPIAQQCFAATAGRRWKISYDVKFSDEATGAALPCTSGIRCPFVRVYLWDTAGSLTIDHLHTDEWAGGWKTDLVDGQVPWNHYERIVDVPAHWVDAERVRIDLVGGPDTWTIAEYDNVEFVPLAPTPAPVAAPPVSCQGELVRGGAFADGTYAPFFPPDGVSLSLVDCAGSDCALKTDKDHWFQGPIVEVPVDCLGEVGSKWRLQFDSYMLDEGGAAVGCASPGHLCPFVRVWFYDAEGDYTIKNVVADWPGGWKMPDGTGHDVPFNRFDTILEPEADWATATKIELHFDGGPVGRHSTVIDNVSMRQIPPEPVPPTSPPTDLTFDVDCSVDLIANGAIQHGTTAPYGVTHRGVDLSLVDCNGDDCALRAEDLSEWFVGATQSVPPRCFTTERQDWLVQFDVQLLDSAGNTLPCTDGVIRCPMLRIRSVDSEGNERYDNHYDDDGWPAWTMAPGGWNHYENPIPTMEYYIGAQEIEFMFVGGPAGLHTLVLDNIMAEPLPLAPTTAPLPLPPDQIYVSPKAAECWGPGAELLITTNTDYSHEYQLVAVHSANPDTGALTLAEDLELPGGAPLSTLANDPRQAVEVARLDRSIVFEAVSDDGDDLIGGHIIFYHTPGIKQHLENVEIRNFGQAGRLGRYPVHFHMCEDAAESIVKRTVVRQSNQRCYVIHGSQNVTLLENVAFDTFGHCYMNEDGSEHSNRFIRNLGAHTKKAQRLIDTEREETDDAPGTFWIVNMNNHFEGNVVAGSEVYGWFVEGHRKIRGPSRYQDWDLNPMLTQPTLFKDNIIHSTAAYGMTTYPRGWTPTRTAVLENMMVYRGLTRGMFIHHSGKLHWKGGYFINNRKSAIEMDGADELTVEGMTIVDRTASERDAHCKGSDRKGIIIHPVKQNHMNMTIRGTTLIDLDMMDWGKNRCENMKGHPLQLGDGLFVYRPIWDIPTLFDNVMLDLENQPQDLAETFAIDGCLSAAEKGMKDVAIEVTNDNQRIFSAEGADGFVVSPSIASLLDPAACRHLPGTTAASSSANYEAEDQQWDTSSYAKTSNPGYTGDGYIDMGSTGSFVKFTDVDGTTGGTCTLTIRYANQNPEDRPLSVAVNGYVIGTLAFPSTGSWSNWQTEMIETTCSAGSNEIVLTATDANGPNLDSLDYAVSEVPGCLKFCPGTCLRTILFHTDVTTSYNMVVRDSYNPQRQHSFPSQVKMGTTFTYSPNYYGVSLPEGAFDISFRTKDTDELGWPSFVAPVILNAPLYCDDYATETTFNIIKPSPTRSSCNSLIRGGNFNTAETVADWLVISTDIEYSDTGGVGGSGALTYNHKSIVSGVSQWIDTSCLVAGGVYEFEASYRVLDASTGKNQDQTHCAGSSDVFCMHAWIEFRENDNSVTGDTWSSVRQTVGRVVEPHIEAGSSNFGSVKGTWTVTEDQVSERANRAVLHINNVRSGGTVIVDQVSLNRV